MTKLWLALDFNKASDAVHIVRSTHSSVDAFKIGMQLFTLCGPSIVSEIRALGAEVFLDLKFCDIPNTVAGAVASAAEMDVSFLTVHAFGGATMMRAAAEAGRNAEAATKRRRPTLLAITVLTSIDDRILHDELGISCPVNEQVVRLAQLAQVSGMDGVVASIDEVESIRATCGPEFLIVTPGIRPSWEASVQDQLRVGTPADAAARGASAIVVGRPISRATDPSEAAARIRAELLAASVA